MSNPKTVQIKVTEKVLKMNGQVYGAGDIGSFSPSDAKIISDNGWGECTNGEFETGARVEGSKRINPDDLQEPG